MFLPGFAEIQQLYEALTSHKVFGARSGGRSVIHKDKNPINLQFCIGLSSFGCQWMKV